MSPEKDEQQTIRDYLDRGDPESGDTGRGVEDGSNPGEPDRLADSGAWPREATGFDSPAALLEYLEHEDGVPDNPARITGAVARYLDGSTPSLSGGSYHKAVLALERILEAVGTPVDTPEMFRLLDNEFVDRELVIEHLLALVPVPIEEIPPDISIDTGTIDDLSAKTRMDCYEVLAHGPPDPDVFSMLLDVASTLGSRSPVPGDSRNPTRWRDEHARRVALGFVNDRDAGIGETTASRAVQIAWSDALPDIADSIHKIVDTRVNETVINGLEDGRGVDRLSNTRLVDNLVREFLDADDGTRREASATTAILALEEGYSPSSPADLWDDMEEALFGDFDPGYCRDILTGLLTESLARDVNVDEYIEQIAGTYTDNPGGEPDVEPLPTDRAAGLLAIIRRAVHLVGPDILSEGSTRTLAEVTRAATGESRKLATDCLVELAGSGSTGNLLARSGALSTIIGGIDGIRSAGELRQYGRVLISAGVYPVPGSIRAHYDSTNEDIETEAKRIARDLRRQFRERPPACHPDRFGGGLETLAERLSIKYRCEDGIWRALDLAPPDRELLTIAGQACKNREDVQVALPYQDPVVFDLALLAAALVVLGDDGGGSRSEPAGNHRASVGNAPGIAIYSPGTSARWGTIRDIEHRLTRLGIGDSACPSGSATPLIDLIPRGKIDVDEGTVNPDTTGTTVSDNPPVLPVARSFDELAAIEPAVVLYNLIPSVSQLELDALESVRGSAAGDDGLEESGVPGGGSTAATNDDRPSAAMIEGTTADGLPDVPSHGALEVYGPFTARETDGWHTGTGPPGDLPGPVVPGREFLGDDTGNPPVDGPGREGDGTTIPAASRQRAARASRLVGTAPQVIVHQVRTGNDVTGVLEQLYEITTSLDLRSADERNSRTKIVRFQRDLERLPVPAGYHDDWVREQRAAGQFGVPASLVERANAIEDLGSEYPAVSETVHEASIAAHAARRALADENPLFEALLRLLDDARREGDRVGILCPKKSHKDILYDYLQEHAAASGSELDQMITMLDHDTVRTPDDRGSDLDRLIRFGIGERQTAVYYCHPSFDRVDVVAYGGTRPALRVERVFEAAKPVFPAGTGVSLSQLSIDEEDIQVDGTPGDAPDRTPFVDPDSSLEESLFLAYLTDDGESSTGSASGSAPEPYRLDFEDGSSRRVMDSRPLIVQNRQQLVSRGDYTLQRVPATSPGDVVVVLDAETRNDLWQEYLEPRYETGNMDTVVDAIRMWYEAIETAIGEVEPDDGRVTDATAIYRELQSDIPESRAAVRGWVNSVKQAEDPRDLLFRREFTLGPEVELAVEAVAEQYGSEAFRHQFGDVFDIMESVRDSHANYGHRFWEELAEKACDGNLFDEPGVTERTVSDIEKLSRQ